MFSREIPDESEALIKRDDKESLLPKSEDAKKLAH